MASLSENTRKRKQTTTGPEIVVSSDDDQSKSKARRVSTDASASIAPLLQVDTPVVTEEATAADTASAATVNHEESIQSIGKMIQDLFHSDNAKVNAALDALCLDLVDEDKKKRENIQAVGGCLALVQLVKKCLDKAIGRIQACDRVTKLNVLAELQALGKSQDLDLPHYHNKSKVGMNRNGCVEVYDLFL